MKTCYKLVGNICNASTENQQNILTKKKLLQRKIPQKDIE